MEPVVSCFDKMVFVFLKKDGFQGFGRLGSHRNNRPVVRQAHQPDGSVFSWSPSLWLDKLTNHQGEFKYRLTQCQFYSPKADMMDVGERTEPSEVKAPML